MRTAYRLRKSVDRMNDAHLLPPAKERDLNATKRLYRIIGHNIWTLRLHFEVTRKELSDAVSTCETNIQKIELGQGAPSIDLLRKIAQAFGVEPYSLLVDNRPHIIKRESKRLESQP